jgi:hypothetical protein
MTAITHLREGDRGERSTVRAPGLNPALLVPLGLVVGAAVGSLTSVLQAHADGASESLVNAISPWLAPAFAVGAFARRPWHAAVTGLLICLAELAAYDVTAFHRGYPQAENITLFWACGAVAGGLLFGWAGCTWWRATGPTRGIGLALMSSAFLTEAAVYAADHHRPSAELFTAIGVALFFVLGLRGLQHARATAWLFAALPLGAVGELLVSEIWTHVG